MSPSPSSRPRPRPPQPERGARREARVSPLVPGNGDDDHHGACHREGKPTSVAALAAVVPTAGGRRAPSDRRRYGALNAVPSSSAGDEEEKGGANRKGFGFEGGGEIHDDFTTGVTRRLRQQRQQRVPAEAEGFGGLVRRCIGSVGVVAVFVLAVNTTNYKRSSDQLQQQAEEIRLKTDAAAHPGTATRPQDPGVDHATVLPLKVSATNEYGQYSGAALALYGLEMLVEPFRETKLTTSSSRGSGSDSGNTSSASAATETVASTFFFWRVEELDVDGSADAGGVDPASVKAGEIVFEAQGGPEVSIELRKPGGVFVLTVEERVRDGAFVSERGGTITTAAAAAAEESQGAVEPNFGGGILNAKEDSTAAEPVGVVARATVTISCKYVRRELRKLSDEDREAFLGAMEVYYGVSTEDGQAEYGEGFFNYERLAAYHNADLSVACYHGGVNFLTAHAAFGLTMERSLQAVNPRVSLPLWDYMIESETLGADWAESTFFDDDIFGRAMGSPENSHQLEGGRFGGIASITKPDDELLPHGMNLHCPRNALGYLSPTHNYQDVPLLTRAGSFCNLKADSVFPSSDAFFRCFDENDTLTGWEYCMERKVHGDIHSFLGGAFNCKVDMHQFHVEHPEYDTKLLTFVLSYLTTHYWPRNLFSPESNVCDEVCARGQAEPCGCTCTIDAMAISEDEVRSLTSGFMTSAIERNNGDEFVSCDESLDWPWGFKQDGVPLDDDATMLLLRLVVKLGCEPSAVGGMVGGASPMDPAFWVIHQLFEKALHVLWMSPRFRDGFTFDWEDGTCAGSKLHDALPFTERDIGMGSGTEHLTNFELMSILHASNPQLPYVYDSFDEWGTVTGWDFCPECTASAGVGGGASSSAL